MRPTAGELNRRILIRKRSDLPTMGNALSENYTAGVQAGAKLTPVGNATFFGTQQVGENVTHSFVVRRRPEDGITAYDITGDYVIDCEGYRYRVRRCDDLQGDRHTLLIQCELLGIIPA
jgi:hypothetical protein